MAIDRWFIGGGAEHTPESARRLVYAATGGAEGVGGPDDLKVTPLDVPGAGVRILTGSGLMKSLYVGGQTQTYMGSVYEQETVSIGATGSGAGRSDLVVMRVEDPFAAGSPWEDPLDPASAQYVHIRVISGVPAGTRRVQDVPGHATDTAITLARVDLPPSTGTVTSANLVDLRTLASPEREDGTIIAYPSGAFTTGRRIPSAPVGYGDWPLEGDERPLLNVPSWANYILVTALVEGAWYAKGNSNTENFIAGTRVRLGDQFSENGIIVKEPTDAGSRGVFAVIGRVEITEEMRGVPQRLSLQGVSSSGPTTGGMFVDYQSCISMSWTFSQSI